jgi:hypothetical protein
VKVIIEQTAGKDYPSELKGNKQFYEKQKEEIVKRLEMRSKDEVEIREV